MWGTIFLAVDEILAKPFNQSSSTISLLVLTTSQTKEFMIEFLYTNFN